MQESRCTEFEKRGVVDDEKSCPAEIAPYEWLVGETRIIFLFVRIMPTTASPRGRMNRRRCARECSLICSNDRIIMRSIKEKKRKRKRKKRKYQREIDSLLASLTGRFRVHPEREGEREEDKEREEQYGTVARNPRPFPLFLL